MKTQTALRLAAVIAITAGAAGAQVSSVITGITDAAAFRLSAAAEGYIAIFGTNLADGIYQTTGSPYAAKLGSTEIFVCPSPAITSGCLPAGLTYASPTQVNAVLSGLTAIFPQFAVAPVGIPAASPTQAIDAYFIARVNGIVDSAAAAGKSRM